MAVWAIVSSYLAYRVKKRHGRYQIEWSSSLRVRRYFALFAVDMVFICFMTAACAVASTYLPQPWTYASCTDDFCHQELTIQIMAIMNMSVKLS